MGRPNVYNPDTHYDPKFAKNAKQRKGIYNHNHILRRKQKELASKANEKVLKSPPKVLKSPEKVLTSPPAAAEKQAVAIDNRAASLDQLADEFMHGNRA